MKLKKELKPPRNFFPAGRVNRVELTTEPPFITAAREGKQRGAKKRGLQYETRVTQYLLKRYENLYVPGPWLQFTTQSRNRWRLCQPDGLIVDIQNGHITVVEIKLSHTALAWWQCCRLYLPIVKRLFGSSFSYSCCEVTKWFDPHVAFPETFILSSQPHRANRLKFTVHIHSK